MRWALSIVLLLSVTASVALASQPLYGVMFRTGGQSSFTRLYDVDPLTAAATNPRTPAAIDGGTGGTAAGRLADGDFECVPQFPTTLSRDATGTTLIKNLAPPAWPVK
jgi:hypothetical protein